MSARRQFDYVPVEPGSVIPGGFHQPEPPLDAAMAAALGSDCEQAQRPLLYVGGGAISACAHDSLRDAGRALISSR